MNKPLPANILKLIAGAGGGKAFPCPCGGNTGVNDTRATTSGIRRRRICLSCGHRFTTFEIKTESSTGILNQADLVASSAESLLAAAVCLGDKIDALRKIIEAHRTIEAARFGNAGPK